MLDGTFRCVHCGRELIRGLDKPGRLIQCEFCKAHVVVPPMNHAAHPDHPATAAFRPPKTRGPIPLQAVLGFILAGCVVALAVIFFSIQRSGFGPSDFAVAIQAAEKAGSPEDGIQLIDQLLSQHRLGMAQKVQAEELRSLLQKRIQVDATFAALLDTPERQGSMPGRRGAGTSKIKPPTAPPVAVVPIPLPPELALADAQTAYRRGVRLASEEGAVTNMAMVFTLITKAAQAGLSDAQHDLAAMYSEGMGCATDQVAALSWCQKAAAQGDAESLALLGYLYAIGKDVPADPVQAAQWNEQASVQGSPEAAFNLGVQYVNGRGIRLDCVKAFEQFSAAAARGNAEAQVSLGVLYWKGLGVAQDPTNAFLCFQKAHEQGNLSGTFALGLLYGAGVGVVRDRQMAAALCLAAARNGHVGAQKQMGRMYLAGSGVTWSEQEAIYWYRQAAAQGDEAARLAVEAYHNMHLPPVLATCETCQGKGVVAAFCPNCRGTGKLTETVTSTSIKNCVCGWQMVNGRCPNCGRVDPGATQTRTIACALCNGTGRLNVPCKRCNGSGQVHVSGPAQATFEQMVNRADPGISLTLPANFVPVRLHPFRSGVNRQSGL